MRSTILRQLRAALVMTVTWCLASALVGVLVDISTSLAQGFSPTWYSMWFNARLFGILGLAFGATFALAFVALARFLPKTRVPTWLAAIVGGGGAPLGGMLLLISAHSMFANATAAAVMTVVGTVIGTGIGFTANRGALPAGDGADAILSGRAAIGAGEG